MLLSVSAQLMICRICRNFPGELCVSCRTVKRLRFLLVQGHLPLHLEGRVVEILRQAAGAITDLYEEFGRPKPAEEVETGGTETDGAAPALSSNPSASEVAEAAAAEEEKVKERKAKKEAKKSKKEETKKQKQKEREAGAEEAAEESRAEEEEEDKEIIRAKKAARIDDSEITREDPGRDTQEEVDQFVSDHPERFGLGSLSVRGSAARHLRQNDERRRERPAEPVRPPPVRSHRREIQGRDRSRSKKRKSKGAAHRERGRVYWQKVRERDLQWHQRQEQRQSQRQPQRGR